MSNNIQWPQLGGGGAGAVDSVNGQTGTVVLDKGDIGLSNVDNVSLLAQDLAQKEPTGFENRTDSSITFDDMTRTFFIATTGLATDFKFWVKGVQYVKPSMLAIGIQVPPVTGLRYIYFDNTGNIAQTNAYSETLFTDNCIIAIVYWNQSTNSHVYLADERHGITMDGATNRYLHQTFGTRYLSGLALENFVPDGTGGFDVNAQFSSDIGTIADEDITFNLSSQFQFPVLYRVGDDWYKKTADNFPVIYNGTAGYTGTRIAYNQYVAPNWQLTEVADANYVLVHVFATNDAETPVVAILGTTQYANAPQARAGAETEINSLSGLPFAEFTALGSVIFETRSSYSNTPKARVVSSNAGIGEVYVDFRGEQLYTPSGVASSHSLLSNLGSDDHSQYHNDARGDARYVQKTGDTMTGALVVSGSAGTGNSLVRITNTGLGDCFVVEDSANPDSTPFKIDASGFVYMGSLLSTSGTSGKVQLLDSANATFECRAGATNSLQIGATTTLNRVDSYQGSLSVSSVETGTTISISPATDDGFGASIFTKSNGSQLVTGINNITPTEALDVTGNVLVSGTITASNLPFIPPPQGNEADHHVIVNMGSSTLQNTGNMTSGATGTGTLANFSSASFIGKLPHITYSTTSTAGSTCGHRMASSVFGIGGGIRFQTIFQVSDTAPVANARHFCGLNTTSTATPVNSSTNNNPLVSSLTNFIAFAHDGGAGDTNFCIYHNAGSAGSTTRISLGASFPSTNTGEVYQVHFYSPYNTGHVMYEIKALVSGAVARGTITTNLPTTSLLYFHNERFNGGTSNNVKFEAGSLFGWTGA